MSYDQIARQFGGVPTEEQERLERDPYANIAQQFGGASVEETTAPTAPSFDAIAQQFGGSLVTQPPVEEEDQSFFRSVADVPLKIGGGVVQGIRMISDFFGADNPASQALKASEDYIASLYSAQSRNDSQEIARIMDDAKDKGVWDQVKAGVEAFSVAPVDFVSQALGTTAPIVVAALSAKVLGATKAVTLGVSATAGAVTGTGLVKGTIYDAVYEELTKIGVPEDVAKAKADEAQAYGGENLDMILTGTALGALASSTGIEPALAKSIAGRVLGKAAAKDVVEETVEQETKELLEKELTKGVARRVIEASLKEAVPEGLQAAQEQLAENLALQRQGFDVPLMRGVTSQATLELLAAGVLGGSIELATGKGGLNKEDAAAIQDILDRAAKISTEEREAAKEKRDALVEQYKEQGLTEDEAELAADEKIYADDVTRKQLVEEELAAKPAPLTPEEQQFQAATDALVAETQVDEQPIPEPTVRGRGPVAGAVEPSVSVPSGAETAVQPTQTVEQPAAAPVAVPSVSPVEVGRGAGDVSAALEPAAPTPTLKQQQLKIIEATNPAPNENLAWVRSTDDIRTAEEAFAEPFEFGENITPDFTLTDAQKALDDGEITVYSSFPIENGVFVTPSKMEAESYAGGKDIYSKKVPLADVAWIDAIQGQFASVPETDLTTPQGAPSAITPSSEFDLAAPPGQPVTTPPPAFELEPTAGFVEPTPTPAEADVEAAPAQPKTPTAPVNPDTGLQAKGKRRGSGGRPRLQRTPKAQAAVTATTKEVRTADRNVPRAIEMLKQKPGDKRKTTETLAEQRISALATLIKHANSRIPQILEGEAGTAAREALADLTQFGVTASEINEATALAQDPTFLRAEPAIEIESQVRDEAFAGFDTATQALDHIIKTGNPFEKMLARRLKPFVKGIKLVRVANPDTDITDPDARTAFYEALGLYSEVASTGERVVYLRDDGTTSGLTNVVILHEALHGATAAKIDMYIDPAKREQLSPEERKAISDMFNVMQAAQDLYMRKLQAGKLDEELALQKLYDAGAFTDLREFVSYGMTQPEMQEFLLAMPTTVEKSTAPNHGMLTRFVQAVRKLFGMDNVHTPAMQDLIVATDSLLDTPPFDYSQRTITALNLAAKQTKNQDRLLEKIKRSKWVSDLNKDIGSLLMESRNAENALDVLRAAFNAVTVQSIRNVLPTLPTMDITRWVGDRISNIKKINGVVAELNNRRAMMTKELAETIPGWVEFNKRHPKGAELLADIMHMATIANIDVSKHPTVKAALQNDTELQFFRQKIQDPSLSGAVRGRLKNLINERENNIKEIYKMWEDVGAFGAVDGKSPAHAIYTVAKRYYEKNFERHQELLYNAIEVSQLEGDVNDPTTPKGSLIAAIIRNYQEAKKMEVYFPLMRYGRHWLRVRAGKDSEYYMFESATARNNALTKRVKEIQAAGDQRTQELMFQEGELEIGDNVDMMLDIANGIADPSSHLREIFAALEQLDKSKTDISAIKDSVYQMYLMTLPDSDIRKRFSHRKARTGFSDDVLRNFIVTNHTAINQLSRLEFQHPLDMAIGEAQAEIQGKPDRPKLEAFISEIELRANAEIQSQTGNDLFDWDKMAALGNQWVFFYMLSAPKSAAAQLTQLPIVGLPVLTARYGMAKTMKVALRYSNLFKSMGMTKRTPSGHVITEFGAPSVYDSDYAHKKPMLKKAWEWFDARDVFMSTYASDMTGRSKSPTAKYDDRFTTGYRAAVNFMSGLFHHSERITREIMAMSSFELAFEAAKKRGLNDDAAFEDAVMKARDDVYEALFNYTQYNKPRIMRPPLLRVATQFMTFPLQMTSYMIRNFYGMIPFLNKEGKREAATMFFGAMGMAFMFGGVTGLWGYSTMLGVVEGVREALRPEWEDEDEDPYYYSSFLGYDTHNPLATKNLDLWLRNYFIPEFFGPGSSLAKAMGLSDEAAAMLQRSVEMGPISALTDMNIGSSTSLNDLWFRSDNPDTSMKNAWQQMVYDVGFGAFGSMTASAMAAIDDFNDGQFTRGVEKLMPAIFRGPVTAMRLSEEGMQTRQGYQVLEPEFYTAGRLLAQAASFPSTEAAQIQKTNFKAKQVAVAIEKQRSKTLNSLDLAFRRYFMNPTKANEKAIEKAFDNVYKFNYDTGYTHPIDGDTIYTSLQNRFEGRAEALQGLSVNKKLRPYIYEMTRGTRSLEYR